MDMSLPPPRPLLTPEVGERQIEGSARYVQFDVSFDAKLIQLVRRKEPASHETNAAIIKRETKLLWVVEFLRISNCTK